MSGTVGLVNITHHAEQPSQLCLEIAHSSVESQAYVHDLRTAQYTRRSIEAIWAGHTGGPGSGICDSESRPVDRRASRRRATLLAWLTGDWQSNILSVLLVWQLLPLAFQPVACLDWSQLIYEGAAVQVRILTWNPQKMWNICVAREEIARNSVGVLAVVGQRRD